MYTSVQIREYSYLLGLLSDLDSLKELWRQDPKLASQVENFNAYVMVLEAVEALSKRGESPTYLALIRYFAEEVLENGILMGAVEKNIKNIVPTILKQGYLEAARQDDTGILTIPEKGKELLRLRREVRFLSRVSEECMKH